jgi:hypothetical protein
MGVKIAFDPGTNHTGYCVFRDGEVAEINVLTSPSGMEFEKKVVFVKDAAWDLLTKFESEGIETIAIEKWQGGSWNTIASMNKCWGIRCVLIAVASDFTSDLLHPNKKTIRKDETAMLAKAHGIRSEGRPKYWHNALDAFQIGICAGFDKR